jgi:hypothetical protein
MANNVTVSNSPTSINTDIATRTTETGSGQHIQHIRLDLGTGATESQATTYVPVAKNVVGLVASDLNVIDTLAGVKALISILTDISGNQQVYKSTGEVFSHIASANNSQGNSGYLLIDANQYLITRQKATSNTVSTVAASASSVTLLSSTSLRLGATIYNDSTAVLYIKLGTTASSSSFTIKLQPDGYYEVPFGYTGRIDGIWASATGNARISEMLA